MTRIDEGHRNRRPRGRHAPLSRSTGAIALAALLAGASLAGCMPGSTEEQGLERSEFVEIVTSLREAERAIPESDSAVALFEARKAEILAEYGATEEDLRAFLRSRGDDVEALQATWDTISDRLRYVPGEDAPPSDTLSPDSLAADTPQADTLQADTLPADTLPSDTLPPDTTSSDTLPVGAAEPDTVRPAASPGGAAG